MITFAQLLIVSVTCKVTDIVFYHYRCLLMSFEALKTVFFPVVYFTFRHLQTLLFALPISSASKPFRYICVVLMSEWPRAELITSTGT